MTDRIHELASVGKTEVEIAAELGVEIGTVASVLGGAIPSPADDALSSALTLALDTVDLSSGPDIPYPGSQPSYSESAVSIDTLGDRALVALGNGGYLALVDIPNRRVTKYIDIYGNGGAYPIWACLSPTDENRAYALVYTYDSGQHYFIASIDLRDGSLTLSDELSHKWQWAVRSPSADVALLVQAFDDQTQVCLYDLALLAEQAVVTVPGNIVNFNVGVTPDGSKFFVNYYAGFVYVDSTTGDVSDPITWSGPGAGDPLFPSFTPDGTLYILTDNPDVDNNWWLGRVDLDTGDIELVTGFRSFYGEAVNWPVSPDGRLLYAIFIEAVVVVSLPDGDVVAEVPTVQYANWAAITSDGELLVTTYYSALLSVLARVRYTVEPPGPLVRP